MKHTRKSQRFITALLALIMLGGAIFIVSADHYETFTIEPVVSKNQIEGNDHYFDLLLQPKQVEKVQVAIHNTGDEAMLATIEVADGITGDNAAKLYQKDVVSDVSNKTPLTSISKLSSSNIKVPAKSTGYVTLEITMPDEAFNGVILGGIRVYADTIDTKEKPIPSQGMSVINQINYVIAVQLRNNQTKVDTNLNLKNVGEKLVDYNPIIYANIQNDRPVLMNDVSLYGTITNVEDKKQYGSINLSGQGIMPNTNFDVIYTMTDKKLKEGTYDVYLKINHEDKVWEWNQKLTIKKEVAESINEEAIFNEKKTNWPLIAMIAFLLLLLLLLLFLLWKKRKDDKEQEQRLK